tara:strand:- start:235 stop:405 length:171 start_codon:yes stop_codon:yes gene_type:complete
MSNNNFTKQILSILVGVVIFGIWLSIVGNPHVVETVIGLILAFGSGFYFYFKKDLA